MGSIFYSCNVNQSLSILEMCVFLTPASLLMEIKAQSIQFRPILDKIVLTNFTTTQILLICNTKRKCNCA